MRWIICVCGLLSLGGTVVADDPVSAPPPSEEAKVTAEEAGEFATVLEDAGIDLDLEAFNGLLDWEAIVAAGTRLSAEASAVDKARQEFSAGFLEGVEKRRSLAGEILTALEDGGQFKNLRIRAVEGEQRALFRLIDPELGLNYYEFILRRDAHGRIRAADVYVFSSGERLSETIHRLFVPIAAQASAGLLARLVGWENEFVAHLAKIEELTDHVREDRMDEALAIYTRLPAKLQQDKTLLLLRLRAAQGVGDQEYVAAIAAFKKQFPDDPGLDLVALDGLVLNEKYDEALKTLDRINATVGGDPYLNVLRSNLYLEQKLHVEARKAASQAIAEEPDLLEAYWSLLAVSLQEQNHTETLLALVLIDTLFDMDWDDFTTDPEYAEFAKSPYYAAWVRSRRNAGAEPADSPAKEPAEATEAEPSTEDQPSP